MVEPELLTAEELVRLFRVYDACGQVFEGSTISKLFGHIAALNLLIKARDEALVETIRCEDA